MYLVTDKQDRLIALSGTLTQVFDKTRGERIIFKLDGDVCNDFTDNIQHESIVDHDVRAKYEYEYGVRFDRLKVIDIVQEGSKVKLNNGRVMTITRLGKHSAFLYKIEGRDAEVKRSHVMTWTANGFYHADYIEDIHGRDISEVISV